MRARRLNVLLAAGLTVAALAAPAAAKPDLPDLPDQASDTAVTHARRVCPDPQPEFAACHAHVRTKDDGATPDATPGPTGFSADQLRSAYGLTASSTTTVAV